MLVDVYTHPRTLARLRASSYAADLDALSDVLQQRGHTRRALRGYLRGAAHLANCIEAGLVSLDGLTADTFQAFARSHIKQCRCPTPCSAGKNFVTVSRHFFEVLRERRGWSPSALPVRATTPVDELLVRLDAHLRDERGLRSTTRERYLRDLRVVLDARFGAGEVNVTQWSVEEVRGCVVARAQAVSARTAKGLATALGSLFRFFTLRGDAVAHLAAAVPSVRVVRMAGLPRGLTEEQLSQLLASIDVASPIGLRARAIIQCLVGLGLRAGEVAALQLADVDWRKGTLTLGTSKARRAAVLPLPIQVGEALAAYLQYGRPTSDSLHLFVRHYMPVGRPLDSKNVTGTVRRALRRAGLRLPSMGAHNLRHTTASRLVCAGVGMKAVADIMRHRDIDTTRLYMKVDWPRLTEVALPWPSALEAA